MLVKHSVISNVLIISYNLYPARVSYLYSRVFHKNCTGAVVATAIVYNIHSIVFGKVVIHLCGKTVLRISQKLDTLDHMFVPYWALHMSTFHQQVLHFPVCSIMFLFVYHCKFYCTIIRKSNTSHLLYCMFTDTHVAPVCWEPFWITSISHVTSLCI